MKTGTFLLLTLLIFTNALVFAQHKKAGTIPGSENMFQNEQQEHLALVQFYRWFLAFEKEQNNARVENHLAILSDSVLITTYNGPLHGKAGMLGFLEHVKTWKNSHHIEKTVVNVNDDGSISLEADIVYQNILPDGNQNEYKIHYTTCLSSAKNELPIFTEVKLLPFETMNNPVFEDAYIKNRAKSFMYYWLYLADTFYENGHEFEELVAPGFRLKHAPEDVIGYEAFSNWLKDVRVQYKETLHSFKNFKSTLNRDGTITISADVEWKGINQKGEKMIGELHHDWILQNNPDERFPKMKEMKLTLTKPFQVVKAF